MFRISTQSEVWQSTLGALWVLIRERRANASLRSICSITDHLVMIMMIAVARCPDSKLPGVDSPNNHRSCINVLTIWKLSLYVSGAVVYASQGLNMMHRMLRNLHLTALVLHKCTTPQMCSIVYHLLCSQAWFRK